MRLEFPEFAHEAQTLVSIGVGAVLATIGGFIATLLEARLRRRERERTAALTFGEILASLRVLVRAAEDAHGRGDPFGPLTLRLLRGARREVEAYESNRQALSDLGSTDLRLSLHALMIRFTLALDGVIEAKADNDRDGSYSYLLSLAPGIDPLVRRLVPLAGHSANPYEELTHTPEGPTGGGASVRRQDPPATTVN
jgi:hypothetical protein